MAGSKRMNRAGGSGGKRGGGRREQYFGSDIEGHFYLVIAVGSLIRRIGVSQWS